MPGSGHRHTLTDRPAEPSAKVTPRRCSVGPVAPLIVASACADRAADEVTISPTSVVVESPGMESGAGSMAEGPRTVSDMLPNAKWPWPEDARAHSDILALGTVAGTRQGTTRPADPEPISAATPTALIDFQIDRTISHDGEAGLPSDDIVTLEVVPGVPVGGAVEELVEVYSDMGYSVFLLDLDGDAINDDVDGRVFWAARVTTDGGLRGPNGNALDDNFTRGVDTLNELEQQASQPDYAVDPAERRSDPAYYGG